MCLMSLALLNCKSFTEPVAVVEESARRNHGGGSTHESTEGGDCCRDMRHDRCLDFGDEG